MLNAPKTKLNAPHTRKEPQLARMCTFLAKLNNENDQKNSGIGRNEGYTILDVYGIIIIKPRVESKRDTLKR